MKSNPALCLRLRDRISATQEATWLVLRALLRHRMGSVLPLVLVLLLISYARMVLGLLSPLALLPRSAQVVPFIYPLF
jgi:hypothetical protein